MKKLLLAVLTVVLLSGLVACGPEVLQSDKQRVTNPDVNEAELATLVNGNTSFAFDLYRMLKEEDGNLFYSPYSISMALAMTYAGARGETAEQMADTLHFILPEERLHPADSDLGEELAQRGKGRELLVMQPEGDPVKENIEGFRLSIVNALWGQEGYEFLNGYLDLVERYYGDQVPWAYY